MRSYLLKTSIFSSSSVIGKPWNGCLTELPLKAQVTGSFSAMAFMTCKRELIFKLVLAFAIFHMAIAGDADIISDFIVPPNVIYERNMC